MEKSSKKYAFSAVNVSPNKSDIYQWVKEQGEKLNFEPLGPKSERMECCRRRFIQNFYVQTKEEAEKLKKMIQKTCWISKFRSDLILRDRPFLWFKIRKEKVYIPIILATKAYKDFERHSTHTELDKRSKCLATIKLALQDEVVITRIDKVFNKCAKDRIACLGKALPLLTSDSDDDADDWFEITN